jgi:hypothetical protein
MWAITEAERISEQQARVIREQFAFIKKTEYHEQSITPEGVINIFRTKHARYSVHLQPRAANNNDSLNNLYKLSRRLSNILIQGP